MRTHHCDFELGIRNGGQAIQFWDVTDKDVSREGSIFASFCAGASASPTKNKVLAAFPGLVHFPPTHIGRESYKRSIWE